MSWKFTCKYTEKRPPPPQSLSIIRTDNCWVIVRLSVLITVDLLGYRPACLPAGGGGEGMAGPYKGMDW